MSDAMTLEPEVKLPDLVRLDDFEVASRFLLNLAEGGDQYGMVNVPWIRSHVCIGSPGPLGKAWLIRSAERLMTKLDRYFRDHDRIDTESQAISVIREVATKLNTAGQSLLSAAEVLRQVGKGHQAAQAFQAGKAAQKAAAQYLGE